MLKSYLTIAWRNFSRNKTSSYINILGLAIGMAVAMLNGLQELIHTGAVTKYVRIHGHRHQSLVQ